MNYFVKKLEEEISSLEELLEEKRNLRYEPEYYQDSLKMQELDNEIDEIHTEFPCLYLIKTLSITFPS